MAWHGWGGAGGEVAPWPLLLAILLASRQEPWTAACTAGTPWSPPANRAQRTAGSHAPEAARRPEQSRKLTAPPSPAPGARQTGSRRRPARRGAWKRPPPQTPAPSGRARSSPGRRRSCGATWEPAARAMVGRHGMVATTERCTHELAAAASMPDPGKARRRPSPPQRGQGWGSIGGPNAPCCARLRRLSHLLRSAAALKTSMPRYRDDQR